MEARNDFLSKITAPAHVQIENTALPAMEGLARASRVLREGQKCCKDPSTRAPGLNMLHFWTIPSRIKRILSLKQWQYTKTKAR